MDDAPDDAPKPPPAVPDLKKALENKPEPFAWTPGIAKSAATAGSPRQAPTAFERLNTTGGRLAVMAVVMLIGGAGLSVTAFHDGAGGGGSDLGAPKSTIKSRAFFEKDGVSLTRGRDDSKADRMRINAKAAAKDGYDVGAGDGAAVPGAEGGEGAPMNYDEGGTSRGSGVSAGGAQGTAADANAKGGGATDAFSAGGPAAPKLSSTGKIKFQGMRRISGTAGFRGIGGRQGTPSKIHTRGSSANTTASESGRGGAKGDSSFTSLAEGGSGGAGAGSPGGGGDARGGSGSGTGGGGGGTGAGGADLNLGDLDAMQDAVPTIPDLLSKAASAREAADKEEKKAKILAAGGHLPQAAYHYDKAKKKKDEAEGYEDQANQQTQAMQDQAAGMTPKD